MELSKYLQWLCDQQSTPLQRIIGFPKETKKPGKLVTAIAEKTKDFARDESPWIVVTTEQMRQIESELGRVLCNSGDVLFCCILITAIDRGEHETEDFEFLSKEPNGYLDLRDTLDKVIQQQTSRPSTT